MKPFVSLFGAGNWGKNHAKNLYNLGVLHSVVERSDVITQQRKKDFSEIPFTKNEATTLENHDVCLGGNAKYLYLEIEDLDKEFDYGGDLGLLYKFPNEKLSLGLFGGNVNTPHIGEDLPRRYAGGIAYRLDPDLIVALDYHYEKQEEEENDEFRLGIEYHWLKYLFFRTGVANNPSRWTVGLGLRNRFVSFDYAYYFELSFERSQQKIP